MIEIRFSKNSHGEEIDLSGLPKDLRGIKQSIFDLLQHKNQQVCIIKAKIVKPSPDEVCLSSLSIIKTNSSIKISVSGNCLHIEGDAEKLEIFSSWFEFDDDTRSGYHQHFEHFGNEEWVDSTSSSLVISVKNFATKNRFFLAQRAQRK